MEYQNQRNYKIVWTHTFINELKRIYDYIKYRLFEPKIAEKLYYKIIKSLLELEYFPNRYPKILNSKDRKLIIDNYIVIYQVDHLFNKVFILHIFNSNQDYSSKL